MRIADLLQLSLKVRMLGNSGRDASENVGEIHILAEEDQCCLRVSPGQVPEYLVNGGVQCPWPLPELAFGDKGVPTVCADQDIGLSLGIECLAGHVSLVVSIQVHKDEVTNLVLFHVDEGARAAFDALRLSVDDSKNVVVLRIGERWFWLECLLRRRRQHDWPLLSN